MFLIRVTQVSLPFFLVFSPQKTHVLDSRLAIVPIYFQKKDDKRICVQSISGRPGPQKSTEQRGLFPDGNIPVIITLCLNSFKTISSTPLKLKASSTRSIISCLSLVFRSATSLIQGGSDTRRRLESIDGK